MNILEREPTELRALVVRLEQRVRLLLGIVRLLFTVLRIFGVRLDDQRAPSGEAKSKLLAAIEHARASIKLSVILRVIHLSPSRYHAWAIRRKACALDDRATCPRSSPTMLTPLGKTVEFGLRWGVARLRGGFLLATLGQGKRELEDARFAVRAVRDHVTLFGKPPFAYPYDRDGWSAANVSALKTLGVRDVGLAPRGRKAWAVRGRTRDRSIQERALVEAGVGTIKTSKYGFNRPAARSAPMIGCLWSARRHGLQLEQAGPPLAERRDVVLVG